MTLGYTPACTDRMHTASGTLTTLLPVAAAAPDTKAMAPARECTGALWVWVSTVVHCSSCLTKRARAAALFLWCWQWQTCLNWQLRGVHAH